MWRRMAEVVLQAVTENARSSEEEGEIMDEEDKDTSNSHRDHSEDEK